MTRSEAIEKFRARIVEGLVELYETVLESEGRIQYTCYVYEDGELVCLEQVQGDNTILKPNDLDPRELFYITTVGGYRFDLFDLAGSPVPDDPEEREEAKAQIISWLAEVYSFENVDDLIDMIICEARREEL